MNGEQFISSASSSTFFLAWGLGFLHLGCLLHLKRAAWFVHLLQSCCFCLPAPILTLMSVYLCFSFAHPHRVTKFFLLYLSSRRMKYNNKIEFYNLFLYYIFPYYYLGYLLWKDIKMMNEVKCVISQWMVPPRQYGVMHTTL